jgi:hypothetical protein
MADNIQVKDGNDQLVTLATIESGGVHKQVLSLPKASTGTVAQVASSASVVTLQAANAARLALIIFNDSDADLYVKCGSAASLTSYTAKLLAGGYFSVPDIYTGIVTGIWSSANGYAYMTEFTA